MYLQWNDIKSNLISLKNFNFDKLNFMFRHVVRW
jgi:phenylalanyl-tRNA synthetase alpha subunit